MRTHTAEDLEYDLSLLWAYEGEGMNQAELAGREGMSQGHLSRRLARARRYRASVANRDARESQPCEPDEHDLPHLAITDDPARERGHWYEPESGAASVDTGRVRIANHSGTRLRILPINGGRKTEEAIKQHHPDPAGLRGGVG
jgi:hypothetical protein